MWVGFRCRCMKAVAMRSVEIDTLKEFFQHGIVDMIYDLHKLVQNHTKCQAKYGNRRES